MQYCKLQIGGRIVQEMCARIMATADEFDAVLVEVFLDSREKVEQIHKEFNQ